MDTKIKLSDFGTVNTIDETTYIPLITGNPLLNKKISAIDLLVGSSGATINLLNYLNLTGGTLTGDITSTSFIKSDGTANEFLMADGSTNIDVYSLTGHTHNEYNEKPISITYSNLYSLTQTNSLIVGQKYIINDYQTIHIIPNTIDVNTGSTEPLMVTASSTSTLFNECHSLTYPQDIIYYDISNNQTIAPGCTKGYIYRRIDTKLNNDIGFDFRAVKFRRWKLNVTTEHVDGNSASYTLGSVVKKIGTNNIYLKINNSQGLFSSTNYWKLFEWTNIEYVSPTSTIWALDNKYFTIPVDDSSYIDATMFGAVTTYYNNKIKQNSSDIFVNSNTVFKGDSIHSNDIGIYFYLNTIGSGFNNNVIGRSFKRNSIGINFYYNVTGSNFDYNSIGSTFSFNTIGLYFYSNTIQNSFNYNKVNSACYFNVIGNSFGSNVIENYFNSNIIRHNFIYNNIATRFQNNNIGDYFDSNTVKSWFQNNTILNNFAFITIEESFNSQMPGVNFTTATLVYNRLCPKTLSSYSNISQTLRFYNDLGVLNVVSPTA